MMKLAVFLFLTLSFSSFAQKTAQGPHTRVALIGGETRESGIALGVEFRLEPEWHVYWKNPGDSGAAPKFNFEITGGKATEIQWPVPERARLGGLTSYGYNRRVVFPFFVVPDSGAREVRVQLSLEYLVCKVECIPGFTKLDATFPIRPKSADSSLADSRHPIPETSSPYFLTVLSRSRSGVKVELRGASVRNLREIDIFPFDGELFSTKQPTFDLAEEDRVIAELTWDTNAKQDTKETRVLLKIADDEIRGFVLPLDLHASGFNWHEVLRAVLFAFLGGLILNLMPCVFPVLSIKILSLVADSRNPAAARRGGWLYSLGVCASFLLLAILLLVFRASGAELGWGFQLQSPAFVLAMTLLFFLVAMNFLGAIEVGSGAMRLSGSLQNLPLLNSSFGTGVLATLVATPCTAPFMGTALGASLLLPWWASLAIFTSLGAGMAAPFLLLSYFPQALAFLPRPGVWMEKLKEFLAFPLLASAVWLGWVLMQQTHERGFLVLGLTLVGLGFGIWLAKNHRAVGFFVCLVSFLCGLSLIKPGPKTESQWLAYDEQTIAQSQSNAVPVFIDFTASWCLTCQWNKKSVLETAPVMELFAKHGVKLLRADWTDQDPIITKALSRYGRNSVPLYVFIPARGEAILLPELITRNDIEKVFTTKE